MDIRFDGKVVVVTGGSSGIGATTAKEFVKSGGTVIFTGIEDPAQVDVSSYGGAEYYRLDVTKEEEVKAFADYVDQKYGGADVLFNNAGILIAHRCHECTVEEWDSTMNINVKGVFLCSKYFIPQMIRKGGGSIVNTSSMSGLLADYTYFSYNASKGAVANMTRPYGTHTIVSMNPIMVDGTGMCGACRVSVDGETKFACVDGPEFDGHKVDFNLAMKRAAMFKDKEKEALEAFEARMKGGCTCHSK